MDVDPYEDEVPESFDDGTGVSDVGDGFIDQKRQYVCLKKMLGISGVGLNSTTFHVEAIPEVWDAQYKVDPFTKSLRNKAFPFYAQWCEIFGNDRANGQDSQLYNNVVQEDLNTDCKQHHSTMNMEEDGESLHVNQNETVEPISFSVDETSSASKSKRTGSKRKYGEGIEVQFLDTMGNYCDASNTNFGQIAETMGHIAKRVGSEYDNRMRREQVYKLWT
ncbi:hypothetical protein ACS0TY_003059 [Phlomoides rotata]